MGQPIQHQSLVLLRPTARLRKDAPGIGTGPRSFYLALDEWMRDFNYEEPDGKTRLEIGRSSRPAFYIVHRRKTDGTLIESVGTLSVHVFALKPRTESPRRLLTTYAKDLLEGRSLSARTATYGVTSSEWKSKQHLSTLLSTRRSASNPSCER